MTKNEAITEFIQFVNDTEYTVPREAFEALDLSDLVIDAWPTANEATKVRFAIWLKNRGE